MSSCEQAEGRKSCAINRTYTADGSYDSRPDILESVSQLHGLRSSRFWFTCLAEHPLVMPLLGVALVYATDSSISSTIGRDAATLVCAVLALSSPHL